jgi:predicted TIM-barrel fold metal-dependent hydrolase
MKTVDIHSHLLNEKVKFNRFYDKLAISFFGKKFGICSEALIENPYKEYVRTITDNTRKSKNIDKIVLFGVDDRVNDLGETIHSDITVCASNKALLDVYNENKDIIIPFFSINPMRPDALDLIEKYHKLGFKGAKFLQNYWGVDTREERYYPYFDKLAELDIPLIVHIGSESSVNSFKECEGLNMLDVPLKAGVTVIAAHMALSYDPFHIIKALSKNPKNFNDDYFKLLKMLEDYPNLYADISAILTPVRAKVLPHLKKQKQVHHKLLFGTDFPVPFLDILNTHDLPFKRRFDISKIKNPGDRYISTLLEYFPEDNPIWTNFSKVL